MNYEEYRSTYEFFWGHEIESWNVLGGSVLTLMGKHSLTPPIGSDEHTQIIAEVKDFVAKSQAVRNGEFTLSEEEIIMTMTDHVNRLSSLCGGPEAEIVIGAENIAALTEEGKEFVLIFDRDDETRGAYYVSPECPMTNTAYTPRCAFIFNLS